MSELRPIPLSTLLRRASDQYDRERAVFDLPARRFFRGMPGIDFSVRFHGDRASTVVGPAAGPHTQMAQNVALAYLGGARVMELKTVQVHDRLTIPRPCIDMATVGYNVEWSQELQVHESAHEYAKAIYLVEALKAMRIPDNMPPGSEDVLYDTSVGYDLDGIRSDKVSRFLRTMLDASAEIETLREELRAKLPRELLYLSEIPVPSRISECVTLSTFHGCPPDQIESICTHLLEEYGFHVVVKMNPTLMGHEEVVEIVRGTLGYDEIEIPKSAFDHDPSFDEGVDLVRRLRDTGKRLGRTVGAKFTNTLFVKNHRSFFPKEEVMYLSGQPLFVLSLNLAARFRQSIGADFPISYSAGIDAKNYAAAVSAGLTPVTVCTDLLRQGGYGRLHSYHRGLAGAMKKLGASTIPEYILRAGGSNAAPADEAAVHEASLRNHEREAGSALTDERYRAPRNLTPPKKVGSSLELFNCINCDKCIPVCPNNSNFAYEVPERTVRYRDFVVRGGKLEAEDEVRVLRVGAGKKPTHQIANYADLCNDCGNCDVFCPEDGGPYVEKPRVFGSRATFEEDAGPGFLIERRGSALVVRARHDGRTVEIVAENGTFYFYDGFAELTFRGEEGEPSEARLLNEAPEGHVVPVGIFHSARILAEGLTAPAAASYLSAGLEEDGL